ncbi:DUF3822 family protein [Niabella aquatica]
MLHIKSKKITLKEQFSISISHRVDPQQSYLSLQVGSDYFSFCIYDPEERKLLQLKRYTFKTITTGILDEIAERNPVLQGCFDKIVTELDFGFNTFLPADRIPVDTMPLMYLENADQQDHVITELIDDKGIANIYTIAPGILTWMVYHFPSSGYLHAHTVRIKAVAEFSENGLLRVDFLENRFTVIAFKGENLLLAKTYHYSSPVEVSFYLLKICEVFAFSQEQVMVQVAGLIDADSRLYRALYDYFLHILLKPAGWVDNASGLPAHYFTSLNELTTCELLLEA